MEAIQWIIENWVSILALVAAVGAVARAVVQFTPGDKDDIIVNKWLRVINAVLNQVPTLTRLKNVNQVVGKNSINLGVARELINRFHRQ